MNEQKPDRDDIGTLIRLAKQESKIPTERAERVRAAAREKWVQETGRRRRSRVFWSVAAAAAAVAGIAFVIRSIPAPEVADPASVAAHVEHLEGSVQTAALGSDRWSTLWDGHAIPSATALRTFAGRVSLRLDSGHGARIDRDSEVRFLDSGGLELAAGRIYVDSGRDSRDSPIDLYTPYGIVEEIGTQYEAWLNEGLLRLRLREGSVTLHHPDGDLSVNAGQELLVSATQEPAIASVEPYGPHWDWVSEIGTIPDFRGRTADEFLRWLAREKGWELEFADVTVEEAARLIVLEGDLTPYSPDEALQIVATTSRLHRTTEAGVLRVSAER